MNLPRPLGGRSLVAAGLAAALLVQGLFAAACSSQNAGRRTTPTPQAPVAAPIPLPAPVSLAELGVRLAFARADASGVGTLVIAEDDETVRDVPQARGVFTGIEWSPDGQLIAMSFGPSADVQDIYTVAIDGSNLARLTNDGHSRRPTWSPDGQLIAFTSGNGGPGEQGPVATMGADGSAVQVLSRDPRDDAPSWAPDGSAIAVSRGAGTLALLLPADGGETRRIELMRDSSPAYSSFAWSLDSGAVAGVVLRGRQLAIVVLSDNLTSQRQVGGAFLGNPADAASTHPSFAPDGARLIAASAQTGDIFVVDGGATPADLPETGNGMVQVLVPAPDGGKLMFPAVSPVRLPAPAEPIV
jgi:Tol biopolymer transport system component